MKNGKQVESEGWRKIQFETHRAEDTESISIVWFILCNMIKTFKRKKYTHTPIYINNYPLNNVGVEALIPCSQKSTCTFWLPQNLSTNNLLLTGSLIDNKQLINVYFICYVHYTLYCYNKLENKLFKKL